MTSTPYTESKAAFVDFMTADNPAESQYGYAVKVEDCAALEEAALGLAEALEKAPHATGCPRQFWDSNCTCGKDAALTRFCTLIADPNGKKGEA